MRKRTLLTVAALFLIPAPGVAQGLGVGAKLGTLGYGVDAGVSMGSRFVLRGGVAFSPQQLFINDIILPADISGIDYSLEPPRTTLTLGIDAHLLGPLKLMGGIMYRSEDLVARGDADGPVEIGSTTYDASGSTVWARLEQSSVMPYAGIGLGKLTGLGFGVFLDAVLAYSSRSDVVMTASPDLALIPGFNEDLQREADAFVEDAGLIKNFYPMLQFGVKFGFGF
jgi:hypothetical protein